MAPEAVPDVLVVGAGMCGSAAARHLKDMRPSLEVWLVGPTEGSESGVAAHAHGAFNQHSDEGRIARRLDTDRVWATLAERSMARYAAIEEASGVPFHGPVGFLAVGSAGGPYMEGVASTAAAQQTPLRGPLDTAALQAEFPFLCPGDGNVGLFEDGRGAGAGFISPRKLVHAQCLLFERSGGRVIRDAVERIDFDGGGPGSPEGGGEAPLLRAQLQSGEQVCARRVLVCTGATTRWKPLLPSGRGHARLATTVVTQETVRVAVAPEDLDQFAGMPCMVFKFGNAKFGTATSFDSCYVLPPIPYPAAGEGDGPCHYLKIGHGTWFECEVATPEGAHAWMCERSDANLRDGTPARSALRAKLDELFPQLCARSPRVVVDRCMFDRTPTTHPFIDLLPGSRVGLCTGGNGYAAKSSDEIGRVAALMMLSGIDGTAWAYDISRETFAAVFEDFGAEDSCGV